MKNLTSQGKVGFANPENQAAAQAAVLKKYGVPNVQQVPLIKDKAKKTMIERYGADNSFSSPEILEKIAKTNIERYGAANPFSSEEITKKRLATLKENYGVDNPTLSPEIRAKQLETMQERYGVDQPLSNPAIYEKSKEKLLERYGVDNPAKIPNVREKSRESLLIHSDEEFISALTALSKLSPSGKVAPEELRKRLGYKNLSPIYKRVRRLSLEELLQYGGASLVNLLWRGRIEEEFGVRLKLEGTIFSNKRWKVDLFHSEKKIAIDINPSISHSIEKVHPFYIPKPLDYHRKRALDAAENGWILYQVYGWDSEEIVLSNLKRLFGLSEENPKDLKFTRTSIDEYFVKLPSVGSSGLEKSLLEFFAQKKPKTVRCSVDLDLWPSSLLKRLNFRYNIFEEIPVNSEKVATSGRVELIWKGEVL